MPTLEELFAQVDAQREEIIALEQTLVRIPSVNSGFMPTGDETPVCEYIRDWLAEDGIESEILGRTPERGNIIARIEGSNSDAGLMFMSHTDVVPVEEEEKWRFPPFSATIADGRIYGRGASDCKGLLTAQLYAMRLLIRNGIQLEDSLIFCSGADEEHGGRYGFGWLAENHPDKIRAPFAVNEGGGTPIDSPSGLTYLIGTGEKGRLQVEIEVKGVSSHASVPWQGTNALYTLQRVLQRIEAYEPERDTSTSLFDHLSAFAIEHKPSAANVDEIIAEIEPENPRFASSDARPLTHDSYTHHDYRRHQVKQRPRVHPSHLRRPNAPTPERRLPARAVGFHPGRHPQHHLRDRLHGGAQLVLIRHRPWQKRPESNRSRARH